MTTPLPLAVMAVPPLRNEGIRHLLRFWDFVNEEKDYLDFVVKLTIGVMTGGKHVQYCVNKIEVQ